MSSTYSFLNVQAAISGPNGAFSLGAGSGNAEEGITIAMDEDKTTTTLGADGEGMHSLHASKVGTVTVRLLKTSPVNAQLSAMYNADQSSAAVWGQNTITISDTARGDFISARQVAFMKHPDINYAKDGGTVEWTFKAIKIDQLLGAG